MSVHIYDIASKKQYKQKKGCVEPTFKLKIKIET